MKYIIYISSTTRLMTEAELNNILTENYENNRAANITGMMIYIDGTFIHLIEGSEEAVIRSYEKIQNEGYHRNIIKLSEDKLVKPNFHNWSMAFAGGNTNSTEKHD